MGSRRNIEMNRYRNKMWKIRPIGLAEQRALKSHIFRCCLSHNLVNTEQIFTIATRLDSHCLDLNLRSLAAANGLISVEKSHHLSIFS